MNASSTMTSFDVEFTKDGTVFAPAQVEALLDGLDASDLIVLAHGWNNDVADATRLYDELLGNVDKLLALRSNAAAPATLRGLEPRTFAVCRIFWPSKKFTDADLIPGGGAASVTAASASAASVAALGRILDGLADDPERLGHPVAAPARAQAAAAATALAPRLDADAEARSTYLDLVRSLTPKDDVADDDASDDFFAASAEHLFDALGEPVTAPVAGPAGGAADLADGGAASLRDLAEGAQAAARRLANFATYLQMKARAGTVGTTGLAPVLREIRDKHPQTRLHLVGHSFGGRLVTAAINTLDDDTPDLTLSLLQAAYSHNGLSGDFGSGKPGAFRPVLAEHRASGPVIITHTKNDRAVGVAYPLASRIARQNAAALGDENDPYGGMGRNGAQRTVEAEGNATDLAEVGHAYDFAPGKVYNLLADAFIANHSDVRGVQVAYAILSAAAAVTD